MNFLTKNLIGLIVLLAFAMVGVSFILKSGGAVSEGTSGTIISSLNVNQTALAPYEQAANNFLSNAGTTIQILSTFIIVGAVVIIGLTAYMIYKRNSAE